MQNSSKKYNLLNQFIYEESHKSDNNDTQSIDVQITDRDQDEEEDTWFSNNQEASKNWNTDTYMDYNQEGDDQGTQKQFDVSKPTDVYDPIIRIKYCAESDSETSWYKKFLSVSSDYDYSQDFKEDKFYENMNESLYRDLIYGWK